MMSLATAAIASGFADPVTAAQQTFRAALAAMAEPGRIVTIEQVLELPAGLGLAATALALALLDHETPLWLDPPSRAAEAYFRFHCGCPIVPASGEARFAVVTRASELPPLDSFLSGTDEYPDGSATLIVEVRELTDDGPVRLTGPGIAEAARIGVAGLSTAFWQEWRTNHAAFPRGVDVFLTCGPRLCGLPRTTKVGGEPCT